MSKSHSPTRFNGKADSFFDQHFTLDKRMKTPKSIRVSAEYNEEDIVNMNGDIWSNGVPETLEMHVPDRILLVGQEQHVGTKAPPREFSIEKAVLSPEPGMVRVQTPPRILTLDDHFFHAVDDDEPRGYFNSYNDSMDHDVIGSNKTHDNTGLELRNMKHAREPTPTFGPLDVTLPPGEELQHLRRQVGKLTRRVMAVESEVQQSQQRIKIIYVMTVMYFCLKAISWFGRN